MRKHAHWLYIFCIFGTCFLSALHRGTETFTHPEKVASGTARYGVELLYFAAFPVWVISCVIAAVGVGKRLQAEKRWLLSKAVVFGFLLLPGTGLCLLFVSTGFWESTSTIGYLTYNLVSALFLMLYFLFGGGVPRDQSGDSASELYDAEADM